MPIPASVLDLIEHDRLIYERYALTEAEIRVVEGQR